MKSKALIQVKNDLEDIFRTLRREGLCDSTLRHRYAEYLVAYELTRRGHSVKLLNERKCATADLYIDNGMRIEVKSAQCNDCGYAYASFGTGGQIGGEKFDYCVFVIFDKNREDRIKDIFIFARNELKEIKRRRKSLADHSETNPCFLVYASSMNAYSKLIKEYESQAFSIERDLIKNPHKYRAKWGKINL